jgi:hypothetical protein
MTRSEKCARVDGGKYLAKKGVFVMKIDILLALFLSYFDSEKAH